MCPTVLSASSVHGNSNQRKSIFIFENSGTECAGAHFPATKCESAHYSVSLNHYRPRSKCQVEVGTPDFVLIADCCGVTVRELEATARNAL